MRNIGDRFLLWDFTRFIIKIDSRFQIILTVISIRPINNLDFVRVKFLFTKEEDFMLFAVEVVNE